MNDMLQNINYYIKLGLSPDIILAYLLESAT